MSIFSDPDLTSLAQLRELANEAHNRDDLMLTALFSLAAIVGRCAVALENIQVSPAADLGRTLGYIEHSLKEIIEIVDNLPERF